MQVKQSQNIFLMNWNNIALKTLLEYLYGLYIMQYDEGLVHTAKTLLYHEEARIRTLVVNVTLFPFELSQRWDEKLRKYKY